MSDRYDSALRFPLIGNHLIEASAGTGKTFTLALIYLRLILGEGDELLAGGAELMPPSLLVVTFTEAATLELRDRIRQRLVEAAGLLERPADLLECPDDDPLHQLLAAIAPANRPTAARRVRMAAEWMDEAVISTIHGWCHRMLREHAFETRGLFRRELITDQRELLQEAANDYWRGYYYPLESIHAALIREVAKTPADLVEIIKPVLTEHEPLVSYQGEEIAPDDTDWRAALEAECATREEAKRLEICARASWLKNRALIDSLLTDYRPHLNGRTYPVKSDEGFQQWLQSLADWAAGLAGEPMALQQLARGRFRLNKSANGTEPENDAFDAVAEWLDARQAISSQSRNHAVIVAHAACRISHLIAQRLNERAEMGFNDLLGQLADALGSEHGERLAATIRNQFPVAMIDEFQDTDPLQYRIFNTIYPANCLSGQSSGRNSGCHHLLLMIGDPKQAIYAFRNADIHTYLQASAAIDRHGRHSLEKNHRATSGVVEACNHLFKKADSHPEGAFLFRNGQDDPIPFRPVTARGRKERLLLDGKEITPLTIHYLQSGSDPSGRGEYRQLAAARCAERVASWLQAAAAKRCGLVDSDDGELTPLRPEQIAILVRDYTEANAIRSELDRLSLPSVYLSDRDSVMASKEAHDLLLWLRACASPTDDRLVRAAIGSNSLHRHLAELARLHDDEIDLDCEMESFHRYRQIWQRRGVLAMIQQLIHDYRLPARLLAESGGERTLTNLLHLGEWLQQESSAFDGEQALIRHFAGEIDQVADEWIVRLESDAERIKVVTIHKSKGLEYPVVLLPFVSSWRRINRGGKLLKSRLHDRVCLDFAPSETIPELIEEAKLEQLREEMRLLYVALTRACHAIWMSIAPLKYGNEKRVSLHEGAVGYLLNGREAFDSVATVRNRVEELASGSSAITIETVIESTATPLLPIETGVALEAAACLPELHRRHWWIASYSRLRFGHVQRGSRESYAGAGESASEETGREESLVTLVDEDEIATPVSDRAERITDLHELPGGSQTGTFLHGLLEWAAAQPGGFSHAGSSKAGGQRRAVIDARCRLRGLARWSGTIDRWLVDLLARRWRIDGQSGTLSLNDLQPGDQVAEMEFQLAVKGVSTEQIDQLLQQQILPGRARPPLDHDTLNGMLKGFIDLVCCWRGRYYLIDWKSNRLGSGEEHYNRSAIEQAILNARYDLQYTLYLLALHRLLKSRLGNRYCYENQIGGAIYLFLRGSNHPQSQGLHFDCPPVAVIERLDRLFDGGE